MKRILFTLLCILALYNINAQVLYGTASKGGANNGGTIAKLNIEAKTLTAAFSFDCEDGSHPHDGFVQASDGKLYGTSLMGGINGVGIIFSYDPFSTTYTKLRDFDGINGDSPNGKLIQASNGKLYGTTSWGGLNNYGVIFSYDPITALYEKLKDFDSTDGRNPCGTLIQASDGKLYGMTRQGGSSDYGVIFSYDPATALYEKLKDFNGLDGSYPNGSFVQASDGKLYGMTSQGGNNIYGVIFSYDPATATYAKLQDFDGINGGAPRGNLVQASDGKLYGMAMGENGVIFSYDPATATYTKLQDFDGINGSNPYGSGSLVQASDGKLYGMTYNGGNNNYGVIFSYDPVTLIYTKLQDFDGSNGATPDGSLMQASDGKLYGMTYNGGNNNYGVIFSYDPVNFAFVNLRKFNQDNTGRNMPGGLIKDQVNKLYGMTQNGGNYGGGTIFSYDAASSTFSKLKDFDSNSGFMPFGSLLLASDGKLYGMTNQGGNNGAGVIFSCNPSTGEYQKLINFSDSTDGAFPFANLIQASDGKLYGMTPFGGNNGYGIIFSYDPATAICRKLKDFDGSNGATPYGSLMQASDGKLYGMTLRGGGGYGTIFSYDPATEIYTKLKDFNSTNGSYPHGSLIQASDGKLYGMTTLGGNNNYGVIFSYDASTASYTKLKSFNKTNGAVPYGSLMQTSDGKLYGMTNRGGRNDSGVSFAYDPITSTYTKLREFNGKNGLYPEYTSFIEIPDVPVTVSIADASVKEGNIATKNMSFIVSLSAPATRKVSVNYQTQSGTAVAESDYESTSGTVTFNAGVTQKLMRVLITSDKAAEPDETFTVLLSNPVNAGIADGAATGTIINDDATPITTKGVTAKNNAVQSQNYTVKVWPNPANDFIKVQVDGIADGDITLQLQDIHGKVLKHQKIKPFANITTQQMNVSGLANGMYLLVIIGENGNMHTEKIIIQK